MNRALRELIKEEAENCCELCGKWCADSGTPHHVIKVGTAKILENCRTNIKWTCPICHLRTENEVGYNLRLQQELQLNYHLLFDKERYYTDKEISNMVNIPLKDMEKAIYKSLIKSEFIDGSKRAIGLEVIRFLMGGDFK